MSVHVNSGQKDSSLTLWTSACFLTTTKTSGVVTSTTTQTLPVSVVTKTSVSVTTVTSSFVGTTSTGTATIEETVTSVETETETATVYTSTYTSVDAATTTVTTYGDYCANPPTFSDSSPSNPNVILGVMTDSFGEASFCCQNCFLNSDCVYWAMDTNTCYIYYTRNSAPVAGCATQSCRRGVQDLTWNPPTGRTYGFGPCAGTYQGGP